MGGFPKIQRFPGLYLPLAAAVKTPPSPLRMISGSKNGIKGAATLLPFSLTFIL